MVPGHQKFLCKSLMPFIKNCYGRILKNEFTIHINVNDVVVRVNESDIIVRVNENDVKMSSTITIDACPFVSQLYANAVNFVQILNK